MRHGFSVQALHGDMDQPARTAALEQFRKGEVTLLVASDVAARGLDIPDVSHIYNFDVPIHADDYVHRIGRTGRAGRTGTAITIVAGANDAKAVAAIEKLIGQPIPLWTAAEPQRPRPEQPPREAVAQRQHRVRTRSPPCTISRRRPQSVRVASTSRSRRAAAASRRKPPQADDDSDASHLPAFLLRPVPVKA